jgi:hypothetical protein
MTMIEALSQLLRSGVGQSRFYVLLASMCWLLAVAFAMFRLPIEGSDSKGLRMSGASYRYFGSL